MMLDQSDSYYPVSETGLLLFAFRKKGGSPILASFLFQRCGKPWMGKSLQGSPHSCFPFQCTHFNTFSVGQCSEPAICDATYKRN